MVAFKIYKSVLLLSLCPPVYCFLPCVHRRAVSTWHRSSSGDFFDELDDVPTPDQEGQESNEEYRKEELAASAEEWDERIAQFNRVIMVGRVGNDPDPRYFDDGKVVLNLSLAVRRKYHALERKAYNIKSGEEETDWYGLEIWGRDAEFAAKYVKKGARIGVVGSLQLDEWNDRATGEPRRQSTQRGPSFYTDDDDDDDDEETFSAGSGGFFD
jgi:single-strand DNA-binding protein